MADLNAFNRIATIETDLKAVRLTIFLIIIDHIFASVQKLYKGFRILFMLYLGILESKIYSA